MKLPCRVVVGLAVMVAAVTTVLPAKALCNVYKSRINAQWSADHSHFWYRNDLPKGNREFVLVDLTKGVRQAAFDHGRLAKALGDAGVDGVQAERLPLEQLRFDLNKQLVFFKAKGRHFQWQRTTHQLTKIEKPAAAPAKNNKDSRSNAGNRAKTYRPSRDVSPDGKWQAYIKEHNLFVRDSDGDQEIQLSQDGKPNDSYQAPYWAPNSNNLIAFRLQPGKVGEVHLVESSPRGGGRAKLHTRRYALPGDKFPTYELNWFDVAKQTQQKPAVGLIDFHGPSLRWTADGRHVRYQKIDRGHQRFRVIEVDTFTGNTRNIIDELSKTFIWTSHALNLGVRRVNWLKKSNEIIYLSEQDGWRHLYLVDVETGKTKNPITRGEFVVRYVDRIDEEKRQIWFRGLGRNLKQDPYLVHYYRVNFDGSGLTALTEGDGYHAIQFSPDRQFIIDSYSRVDMAPVHELRRTSDGKSAPR